LSHHGPSQAQLRGFDSASLVIILRGYDLLT
jgi:hypothetical protein